MLTFSKSVLYYNCKEEEDKKMTQSRHYTEDRKAREELINKIGTGKAIATVRVDRGHRNGAELHTITTTGIIIIRNERTNKMITKLIARPGQVRRYFTEITEEVQKVINIAREHQMMNYNLA